jgi:hypothetical protein
MNCLFEVNFFHLIFLLKVAQLYRYLNLQIHRQTQFKRLDRF